MCFETGTRKLFIETFSSLINPLLEKFKTITNLYHFIKVFKLNSELSRLSLVPGDKAYAFENQGR